MPPDLKSCTFAVSSGDGERFFSRSDLDHIQYPHSAIYARFFMHAITESEEDAFLIGAQSIISSGKYMFLEFRNSSDINELKEEEPHFRRYINSDNFKNKCSKIGFRLIEEQHGRGLAVYKNEDPFITRLVYTGE